MVEHLGKRTIDLWLLGLDSAGVLLTTSTYRGYVVIPTDLHTQPRHTIFGIWSVAMGWPDIGLLR